jgi:uncharacterized protein
MDAMNQVTVLSATAGGILLGLASVWLLGANGRVAGISGMLHGLLSQPMSERLWRAAGSSAD